MSAATSMSPQAVKLERSYNARVEDLWFLWTTKEGFESWWGPEGFRVEVKKLDCRNGGDLVYDMIADAPQQIAFMKAANMPLSHSTRGTYQAIEPLRRLELHHMIDFVPGVMPYEHVASAEFFQEAGGVARMVITANPYSNAEWIERAIAGWTSQLTKVEAALAARKK